MKNRFVLVTLLVMMVALIYSMTGCITINNPSPAATPTSPSIPTVPTTPPTIPTLPTLPTTPLTPITLFAVTSVVANVDTPTSAGPCPKTFNFNVVITANGSGTVNFRWERSDNAISQVQTINFASAGSQTVADSWQLGGTYSGWERIHILTPNEAVSNQANFTLLCASAVTNVTASVSTPGGPCPRTYLFSSVITVNGPCSVTYRWERSDSAIAPIQTITFGSAGSQTVTDSWQLGGNYSGWERVHILTPNDAVSNQANFSQTCP